MILNDKQALMVTVLIVIGIFIFGLLDILNNFIVLTFLTIAFSSIIINIFMIYYKSKKGD